MTACQFCNGRTLASGAAIPPAGQWVIHESCKITGERPLLHGYTNPFLALCHATGSVLLELETREKEVSCGDIVWARRMQVRRAFDASELLLRLVRRVALDMRWMVPVPAPVLEYLKTGNDVDSAKAGLARVQQQLQDAPFVAQLALSVIWVVLHNPMNIPPHALALSVMLDGAFASRECHTLQLYGAWLTEMVLEAKVEAKASQ